MSNSKKDSLLEGAKHLASGSRADYQKKSRRKRQTLSMDQRLQKLYDEREPGRVYTLDEIGSTMGVTRERIRQIEQKALQKFYKRWTQVMKKDGVTIEEVIETIRFGNKNNREEDSVDES